MAQRRNHGFTLIELSVVVMIIGLITATGVVVGMAQIEAAKRAATQKRMDAIETALQMYRMANNRLPCPGNYTQLKSDSNYGKEAPRTQNYACSNGSFSADNNFWMVAEGAVPVRTLGLPDDYMYDAWGRKIAYAVAGYYVQDGAFNIQPFNENCASDSLPYRILIKDTTGATKTQNAIYALVSHGINGHGGYLNGSARQNAGSTNANEQTNCHCNASAVATSYDRTYVEADYTESTTSTEKFDDIVRYKVRAQMSAIDENIHPNSGYDGVDLVYYDSVGAQLYLGKQGCNNSYNVSGTYYINDFDSIGVKAMGFSGRNTYFGVAGAVGGTKSAAIYKQSTPQVLTLLSGQPATQPAGTPTSLDFTKDEAYLAIGTSATPYIYMYRRSADTFIKTPNPSTLPGAQVNDVKFSPSGVYLLVAHNQASSKILSIYKHQGTSFGTITQPADQPAGTVASAIAVSYNSNYFAVGTNASPYLHIYKRAVDVFSKLADPSSLPAGAVKALAFSPDSKFLAVGLSASPYIMVYRRNEDTFSYSATTIASSGVTHAVTQVLFYPDSRQDLMVVENTNANEYTPKGFKRFRNNTDQYYLDATWAGSTSPRPMVFHQ